MLSKNIKSISSSEVLIWLGFLLFLCHVSTFVFVMPQAVFNLATQNNPQCWQYFPECGKYRIPSVPFWTFFFLVYLILSLAGMRYFFQKRVTQAYWVLLVVSVLKLLFLVLDRSFMGNYHFMHICYCLIFLFFPAKEESLKGLLAWFYLAAGTLKLNYEWLSGAAVGRGLPFLSPPLQMYSYAYVVLLELFFIWGLFAKKPWVRWVCFAQFLIFHLVSNYWVGFFYPSIMISLLMIFPFSWLEQKKTSTSLKLKPLIPITLFLGILTTFQIFAVLGDKEPSIFSHRRLMSMNMYDARSVCEMNFYIHKESDEIVYNPDLSGQGLRVRCDTNLLLNYAKNICLDQKKDPSFKSMDMFMQSKRTTDSYYQTVFAQKDVCSRIESMSYSDWLRARL